MNIISLGLGVQSTVLYYMSSMNQLPRCDYAIFADTGKEKKKTLEYLQYLQEWKKTNNGIEIIHVQKRNLYRDLLNNENSRQKRFASIPAFTKNADGSEGMLRRQCTGEYKIWQVDKTIREICGIKPRHKMPAVNVWKGITTDEIERLAIPTAKWKTHVYPFVNYSVSKKDTVRIDWGVKKSRVDCVLWFMQNKLPIPPKSSCTFCPYQSDDAWAQMKINEPEDFASAIEVDEAIRNSTLKGVKQPVYLHDSLQPLANINFQVNGSDLWKGECSGECHT